MAVQGPHVAEESVDGPDNVMWQIRRQSSTPASCDGFFKAAARAAFLHQSASRAEISPVFAADEKFHCATVRGR
jgi:hypothetical protein